MSLPVDSPDAPNYDQMLANGAAIVRAVMKSLEDYCIEDYRKRILGLYGQ